MVCGWINSRTRSSKAPKSVPRTGRHEDDGREGRKRGRRGRRSCRRLLFPLFRWVDVPANMQRQVPAVLKTFWVSSLLRCSFSTRLACPSCCNDRCSGPDSTGNCLVSVRAVLGQGSDACGKFFDQVWMPVVVQRQVLVVVQTVQTCSSWTRFSCPS